MLRVLQTADWHLADRGTIAGKLVLKDGVNLTLFERIQAVNRIVEFVVSNPVSLVVIPGDLFDHPNPEDPAVDIAVGAINTMAAKAPVVIVKGNHDGGKGAEVSNALASLKERPGVHVFEAPGVLSLPIFDEAAFQNVTVKIFALPYPRKAALKSDPACKGMSPEELSVYISQKMDEILAGFHAQIDDQAVNILAGHITVADAHYSQEQTAMPFDIIIRRELLKPFDLVCLGHLHDPQEFYSGAIVRAGFGEATMTPGFKVYDIETINGRPDSSNMQFVTLPARDYLTFTPEEFMEFSPETNDGLSEVAIRVKGKALRPDYDAVIRKAKSLGLPFFKNAMEVQLEAVGVGTTGDVTEEPDLEGAIRMWGAGRDGIDKFIEKLLQAGREIEEKYTGEYAGDNSI